MEIKQQAKRIYDHLEKHIGKELMGRNNHTIERYEKLIQGIVDIGTFNAKQAADILIKLHDEIWNNLKTE